MENRITFWDRFKSSVFVFGAVLGLVGGVLDGLRVILTSPHLFNGIISVLAFLFFSVAVYAILGMILGLAVSLIPPSWVLRPAYRVHSRLFASYLGIMIALSAGLVFLVGQISFIQFTLHPVKNVFLVIATAAGTYGLIHLLVAALNQIGSVGRLLTSLNNLLKNRLVMTGFIVLVIASTFQVMRTDITKKQTQYTQPNILLISFDTLGAKHMGCYGYEKNTTPNIDKFAEEGVLFEEHFSVSRSTLPSHMSMLTSVYPSVHKVVDSYGDVLPGQFITLAEILKEYDYETGALVDGNRALNIGAAHGFDQGFDFYEHYPERFFKHEKLHVLTVLSNFTASLLHRMGIPDMHSENIFTGALSWLSTREYDQPFFMFLHTFDIHSDFGSELPYVSPEEFQDVIYEEYSGDFTGCGPTGLCATDYLVDVNRNVKRGEDLSTMLSDEDVKYIASLYDCGIKYTDHWFGRFTAGFEELGLMDNTIIVLTSDHGEEFFEHHQIKHVEYYDEVVKVPLLIRYPRKLQPGTRIDHLTESIDILPTVLELADIDEKLKQFQGTSLAALSAGGTDGFPQAVYGGEDRPVDIDTKFLRTTKYKYIVNGSERREFSFNLDKPEELYDIVADPGEYHNIINSDTAAYRRVHEMMTEWIATCQQHRTEVLPNMTTKHMEVDEETKKELESLGYIK